jgi:hypothetical protein
MIAARPVSPAPVKTSSPSLHTAAFSTLFGSLTANKPVQRTTGAGTAAAASPTSTAAATNPPAATVKIPVSSDGTSLANLMAAASYAGVPYDDLAQKFGAQSVSNPNYQRDLADAIEARLQLVAGPGISTQVYDPNPANDRVAPDLTNTKQFSSSGDQIQGLLNSMWSAVHSGDVNGYHTALQNVDSWYQSNGQQNYQTGLTDGQVAAFNPANRALMTSMPNANASIAAAELAAITGQSASMSNLAEVAQSAAIKT